jgi:hypothetical protein
MSAHQNFIERCSFVPQHVILAPKGVFVVRETLYARYEVFTEVKIQIAVFWFVTPCSVVDVSEDHAASIFRVK